MIIKTGFLEKNRDTVSSDLRELISQTSNSFLLNLFTGDNLKDTTRKGMTLSLQFRSSLDSLMKTLSACHPFFIRCIKPNEFKKPNVSNIHCRYIANKFFNCNVLAIRSRSMCSPTPILGHDGDCTHPKRWLSDSVRLHRFCSTLSTSGQ